MAGECRDNEKIGEGTGIRRNRISLGEEVNGYRKDWVKEKIGKNEEKIGKGWGWRERDGKVLD